MELKPVITAVHVENYGVYGARKMQAALRREKHIEIGRDQTARLMRELGLTGVRRGKVKRTTVADEPAVRPRSTRVVPVVMTRRMTDHARRRETRSASSCSSGGSFWATRFSGWTRTTSTSS